MMKSYQIPFVLLLLTLNLSAASFSVKEQLKQVNSYWAYHPEADITLEENQVFATDRELIQVHLRLVERTLRAKQLPALNEVQKKHRMFLLDALHEYWVEGRFPKNTGHALRTPYFIDLVGTACAVGQLIIKSGHLALAKQISLENNNRYLSELVLKYPQINEWANINGFTVDELAWIQPCYAPPVDTFGLRHPSCHNAYNGYFCPDFSVLQGPLTKSFYKFTDAGWLPHTHFMCGHFLFNTLQAGKYKWEVKDGLNAQHTYTAEMIAPAPAVVNIIKSGDFNSCNGVITVSAQGGVLPYKYYWGGRTETTSVLGSVCEELVTLSFYEFGSHCVQHIYIQTSPLGLKENNFKSLSISPNPVADILQLRIEPLPENKIARVLNMYGQLVLQTEIRVEHTNLPLSQLAPGLYFLEVDNYKRQRFVKE